MKSNGRMFLLVALGCAAAVMLLIAGVARAGQPNLAPAVTEISPSSAPNDLDTPIVITGTGFAPVPTVTLGSTLLAEVGWVSSATLTAMVPWGLDSGPYTMTVANPDGITGTLPNAFTLTQGIGVWNPGELYGGSVEQVVVNPLTPTTLYAASDSVGLFRSRDAGESWVFQYASILVENLALAPSSPNRIYMTAYPHAGGYLYRSDDEGETWVPLTTTFPPAQPPVRECWGRLGISPHPSNPGTVYAHACDTGDGKSGLIKSTDWGQDWEPVMAGLTDTQVTALTFHPDDPDIMVLGTASGNLFRSSDGGALWTYASTPVGYVGMLAVNPFGDREVWVASQDVFGDPCALLKSANADLTAWTVMELVPGVPACAESAIRFAPVAWGGVYSGTVFVAGHGSIYKTSDGGSTWMPFQPLAFRHNLALHPTDPDVIYLADSRDGIYKTTDGGGSWQVVKQGLTAIFPVQMQLHPGQPDIVYARVNNGDVYRATRGGAAWQRLRITDTASILVDPVTPTHVYAGTTSRVYASADGGATWPTFGELVPPPQYAGCNQFPKALLAIPSQPGTLLAGVQHWCGSPVANPGSIYRSTDYGEHWDRVYPTHTQEISQVNDLAYDPMSTTVIYAAAGDWDYGSGILKSTDGGVTWEPVGVGQLDRVLDIEVEPGTHRVFASLGLLPLYVSADGGVTWTPTAYGGGHNVHDIVFAPGNPPVLYDAAYQGLYRSTDGAQSWQPAAGALGQVTVYSLAVVTAADRVILYAGTTGGHVESGGSSAGFGSPLDASGTYLVNAGVYRWTSLMLGRRVYLPLVVRQQ